MKLALVKLLIAFLATLGFYLPHGRMDRCSPGGGAIVDCLIVHITNTYPR